jgi:hypothetical protein
MSDYDRGLKEGRIDALLESHTKGIARINGSIERFAQSVEALEAAVIEGLEKLSSAVRTLQEQGRAAALAVQVAAETLEADAARRRLELETKATELAATASALAATETKSDRSFSKRERFAGLVVAVGAVVVTILTATGHL